MNEADVNGADVNGPAGGPVRPRPPLGPDLGAVLGGLVLVAVAAALALHEVLGTTWDWKFWAAGILVLAGLAVVVSSVVTAARAGCSGR